MDAPARVRSLFEFLKDYNDLRNPLPISLQHHRDRDDFLLPLLPNADLPDYPGVETARWLLGAAPDFADISDLAETDRGPSVLRVERPPAARAAPPLPPSLRDALPEDWRSGSPAPRLPTWSTNDESDDARREREDLYETWWLDYEYWREENERRSRADSLYARLAALHDRLERDAGAKRLTLADGMLTVRPTESVTIEYPVLFQEVELRFDAETPAYDVVMTDGVPELNTALLQRLPATNSAQRLRDIQQRFSDTLSTFDDANVRIDLLTFIANTLNGRFLTAEESQVDASTPTIRLAPLLMLRSRAQNYREAIERLLADLDATGRTPTALMRVIGVDENTEVGTDDSTAKAARSDDLDVLFTKPANKEQAQIARRLDRNGYALVQGPPGTGKTHTIANLLGHLLAQGKRVLVTSQSAKPLRVLRQQVVEPLQPLCVSVLDNSAVNRAELELSVRGIVERLGRDSREALLAQAEDLGARRVLALQELERLRAALLDACTAEYSPITIAGQQTTPSEAAREVARGAGVDDWIPEPIELGAPLPLSPAECVDLYQTNASVPAPDERELGWRLPAIVDVLSPSAFVDVVTARRRLAGSDRTSGAQFWRRPVAPGDATRLRETLARMIAAAEQIDQGPDWQRAAVAAGFGAASEREPWSDLLDLIATARQRAAEAQSALAQFAPTFEEPYDAGTSIPALAAIRAHLAGGGKLGGVTFNLRHRDWRAVLNRCRVNGREPRIIGEIDALVSFLMLDDARKQLAARWDRQLASLGALSSAQLGAEIEVYCAQEAGRIRAALAWMETVWRPLVAALIELGFDWQAFIATQPAVPGPYGELSRELQAAIAVLPTLVEARAAAADWEETEQALCRLRDLLDGFGGQSAATVVADFATALACADADAYRDAFERLCELEQRGQALARRRDLLARLERVAPGWAAAIAGREPPHDRPHPPGDCEAAWRWRQLSAELDRRARASLPEIQAQISECEQNLRKVTADLAEARAWAAQKARTTVHQQQALMGWHQTVRRIGKGTGKYAPRLQAEARRLAAQCQGAVPVWIMPLSEVVRSFDPENVHFDVVILDEASQCDVLSLFAFYLADRVVVVGDDEQVSPDAVGEQEDAVDRLRALYLRGIPNGHLYGGLYSAYDLAGASFGDPIVLREHFRCVPEIIAFSSHLSYHGKILPLREASSAKVTPAFITHRVVSHDRPIVASSATGNEVEALETASLVAAAIEQPEYRDLSIGVISMLGERQARRIEAELIRRVPGQDRQRTRLLCGTPPEFQGDERDVIFLSLVWAPAGGPLALVQEGARDTTKKRFNVAVSRARDQVWIVHSLNPDTDLKPGDLRLRLLKHARNPYDVEEQIARLDGQFESVFERQVAEQLIARGYDVTPQWPVGHYRIDLVVRCGDRRLAIECDGDRFHPPEQLRDDLERQAVLERLGWRFWRIRGSEFFRRPEQSLQPLYDLLSHMEIEPTRAVAAPVEATNDLRDRVVRRAYELRREWADERMGYAAAD